MMESEEGEERVQRDARTKHHCCVDFHLYEMISLVKNSRAYRLNVENN